MRSLALLKGSHLNPLVDQTGLARHVRLSVANQASLGLSSRPGAISRHFLAQAMSLASPIPKNTIRSQPSQDVTSSCRYQVLYSHQSSLPFMIMRRRAGNVEISPFSASTTSIPSCSSRCSPFWMPFRLVTRKGRKHKACNRLEQ